MEPWPADAVERRSVASLVPYAKNARTHSKDQVRQIADSIERFGFTVPVLIDEDGGIIAGHGRVMAAKLLSLQDVPTITARGWTPEKKRAYVLLDNKLALNSDWDKALLRTELEDLQVDFALPDLGFSAAEFAQLTEADTAALNNGGTGRAPQTVIQFNIVFDDQAQQEAWFGFVRRLKADFPQEQTLGARLKRYIEDQPVAAG